MVGLNIAGMFKIYLRNTIKKYSQSARTKRAELFFEALHPTDEDKILDLGSGDGSHIAKIIPYRKNVFIADISQDRLDAGKEKYSFNTVLINEDGKLPFPDEYFDIVFSSSVIEHVTVNKTTVLEYKVNSDFKRVSFERQVRFANEIRRVSKRYFVQTPYKYFPIESHTQFPFVVVFMPRTLQIKMINFLNKWWIKKARPDWNLLTIKDMNRLFPEADIVLEKSLGLIKSIMAIKK